MLTRNIRIKGLEYTIWIFSMDPNMPVVVLFKHVSFVEIGGGIVLHVIEHHSVKCWCMSIPFSMPGFCKYQVFYGNEFHRSVRLWFIKKHCRLEKIGVSSNSIHPWFGCGYA